MLTGPRRQHGTFPESAPAHPTKLAPHGQQATSLLPPLLSPQQQTPVSTRLQAPSQALQSSPAPSSRRPGGKLPSVLPCDSTPVLQPPDPRTRREARGAPASCAQLHWGRPAPARSSGWERVWQGAQSPSARPPSVQSGSRPQVLGLYKSRPGKSLRRKQKEITESSRLPCICKCIPAVLSHVCITAKYLGPRFPTGHAPSTQQREENCQPLRTTTEVCGFPPNNVQATERPSSQAILLWLMMYSFVRLEA